jgi:hypothetical protein
MLIPALTRGEINAGRVYAKRTFDIALTTATAVRNFL